MVDSLFQHTIKLDDWNEDEDEEREAEEEEEEEPDTEDEEEEAPFWTTMPPSQVEIQSQMTQSSSQASSVMAPFGLSQGIGDSMIASQFSVMSDLPEEDDDVLTPSRTIPITMAGMVYADEEAAPPKPSPMRLFHDPSTVSAVPATPSGGFRPVKRAPLGAKSGTPLSEAPSRTFQVMSDPAQEEEEEADEVVPSSQPDDFDAEESFEQPLRAEGEHQSTDFGDGFAMGRQAKGTNRFAPFIDNLTPITERTYEYTAAMTASGRSRRGSVYPQPAPVEEDDEEDEEASTDDEYAGDQAFVGFENGNEDDDSDRSSFQTRGGFSSEDEDAEDDVPQRPLLDDPPRPASLLRASTNGGDSSSDWQNSTQKDGHFADESATDYPRKSISSVPNDRSFDASLNTSLPEGFTITGNQSGMNTGMVVSETTNLSGALSFSNPCNPFDPSTISQCLSLASPLVLSLPNTHDLSNVKADKMADLQKTARRREAAAKSKSKDRTGVIDKPWTLELDEESFTVRQKLGEGTFGAVFQVVKSGAFDPDSSFSSDVDGDVELAVKVEQPTNLWEFHILNQLHTRLPEHIRTSVVRAHELYAFQDESFLFLDFADQGTLLDVVNKANESGVAPPTGGVASGLDEIVAMFFIVELIRIVESFHSSGFLHGDLKIDNCLVRFDDVPGGSSKWSNAYDRTGNAGWENKGLKIIDFGRTIDFSVFPRPQRFIADLQTTPTDCLEMREDREWTYEPDYFGIASIAYNMLFGRAIETKTVTEEGGVEKVVIAQSFRRYHQAGLWSRLFDAMLNPKQVRPDASLPITNELGIIRGDMEEWLELNSKLKNLRSLIRKLYVVGVAQLYCRASLTYLVGNREAFAMSRGRA
ncbi:hypothetical protein P7C70_g8617, partial [Phenoliferia sp. Uapishka_3]